MDSQQGEPGYRYWAFISYSHQDEAWGRWLHQALETYRLPRRLVGRQSQGLSIPRRLMPVFRDRDELPSAAELGAVIDKALAESRNLIVICSPQAAGSRWVNEEIKTFRRLGRDERIFCLIVGGEPGASARPDIAFSECFPPALRGDGDLPALEPVAGDVRRGKDGRHNARLKLIAGMLGLGLDELKQRDRQRALWRRIQAAAATVAVVGLMAGMWQGFQQERAEREREIRIERLVENGRQELLAGKHGRAAVYLTEALALGHDDIALRFMLGRAMRTVDAFDGMRIEYGGDAVRKAAFSEDGRRFALVVRRFRPRETAVAQIRETATGKLLAEFSHVPRLPRQLAFLPGGERLFIRGFENDYRPDRAVVGIWRIGSDEPIVLRETKSALAGDPVSPDGARLLLPAAQTGLELIDARTGEHLRTLDTGAPAIAASHAPDGSRIAVLEPGGDVSLWSVPGHERLSRLPGDPRKDFSSVTFRPDGKKVLALSRDGDLRQWDAASGRLDMSFALAYQRLAQLVFSADSRRFLSIGPGGYKVWNADRGVELFGIAASQTSQTSALMLADAALSADGNTLYTADHARDVVLAWNVLGGRKLYEIDLHSEGVSAVALNSSGQRLLLAGTDGFAEFVATGPSTLWREQSLRFNPGSIVFSPDGRRFLTAGARGPQGFVQERALAGRRLLRSFAPHDSYFFDIARDETGARLVAGAADGRAVVYDTADGSILSTAPGIDAPVETVALGPDRILIKPWYLEGVETAGASLWSLDEPREIARFEHPRAVHTARYSPDRRVVATAGDAGRVKIWNAADGRLLNSFRAADESVRTVDFDAGGERLAAAGHDGTVTIWQWADTALLHSLSDPAMGSPLVIRFVPGREVVAIGTHIGSWLWAPETNQVLALPGQQDVVKLRFGHAGRILISADLNGVARAWDTRDGRDLGIVAAHDNHIRGLDLSADGSRLATADFGGEFAIWDIRPDWRGAQTLRPALRCKVPWKLSGDGLVQRTLACP